MRAVAYLHSRKESMWELGQKIGVYPEALPMFMYALTEVRFELEVDPATGNYKILTVDGLPVSHPNETA